MTCPGFERMLDYLEDRLEQPAAQAIATHLANGCSTCDEVRSWYQRVKVIAGADDSVEPPPWVLKRALRLFNTPQAQDSVPVRAGRLVASLVFDSLRRPAIAGVRSSGIEDRQLLYRANDFSIDVQLARADRMHVALTGQILREGELMFESVSGLRLDLVRDDQTILSTVTNDRGEFTLPAVEAGRYDLRVNTNEASITIAGLPVAK